MHDGLIGSGLDFRPLFLAHAELDQFPIDGAFFFGQGRRKAFFEIGVMFRMCIDELQNLHKRGLKFLGAGLNPAVMAGMVAKVHEFIENLHAGSINDLGTVYISGTEENQELWFGGSAKKIHGINALLGLFSKAPMHPGRRIPGVLSEINFKGMQPLA